MPVMRIDITWIDTGHPGRLAIMARPRGGDWLQDELRGLREAGAVVLVSLLTPDEARELELEQEASACGIAGLRFLSLPIADRDVPPLDAATIAFVRSLADAVRAGDAVVVHCRMGIGRSSLIAASVLRVLGVPVEEGLARLTTARRLPVPDTDEQRQWILRFPA